MTLGCSELGNGELLGMVSNVFFLKEGSPIFMQRYEKKYGRDENRAVPRCLMAAKFISSGDMTGEKTLQHWIAQGQIQDLHQVFRTQLPKHLQA